MSLKTIRFTHWMILLIFSALCGILAKDKEVLFMSYKAAIISLSDNASKKVNDDVSVNMINEMISQEGFEVTAQMVLGDDPEELKNALIDISDNKKANLVLTSGGNGLSRHDNAPEATLAVLERLAPGFSEAIRVESMKHTPRGMLFRGVSGIRGETLIINLPGSPRAIKETLGIILPALQPAIRNMLSK